MCHWHMPIPQGDIELKITMNKFSRYKDTPKYITELSRTNRSNPTVQEEKLWARISGKKLDGSKFRRQFPIGRYIVDFYNHANRLVIEIDGSIHETTKEYDRNRDLYLNGCGYNVVHFTNDEIDFNIESVVQSIRQVLQESPPAGDSGGVKRTKRPFHFKVPE